MYWIQVGKLSPEIAGLYLDQIVRFNPLKYNSNVDILNCPGGRSVEAQFTKENVLSIF